MRKKILAILFLLLPLWCLAWPTKDITIIVPYGPGGATDIVARGYQSELEKMFGVQVIVKFMPGGATLVAANHILSTDNDNHTFMLCTDDFITASWFADTKIHDKFTPVIILGSLPYVVFGSPDASRDKFIQQMKNGQTVNIANLGLNSAYDIWLSTLKSNLKINPIPYKSTPSIMTDLLGGHVEYAAMSIWSFNANSDKKIVPIMTSSDVRSSTLPNVPTFKELGFNGEHWNSWWGAVARKDTSPEALATMNRALREAISKNAKIQEMGKKGLDILSLDLKESDKIVQKELFTLQRINKTSK